MRLLSKKVKRNKSKGWQKGGGWEKGRERRWEKQRDRKSKGAKQIEADGVQREKLRKLESKLGIRPTVYDLVKKLPQFLRCKLTTEARKYKTCCGWPWDFISNHQQWFKRSSLHHTIISYSIQDLTAHVIFTNTASLASDETSISC